MKRALKKFTPETSSGAANARSRGLVPERSLLASQSQQGRLSKFGMAGCRIFLLGLIFAVTAANASPVVGPTNGTLIIVGGGLKDASILKQFIELAGGPSAPLVLIPTANESNDFGTNWTYYQQLHDLGATNLTILHTRDRKIADSENFIHPLQTARGVWIGGGRQWRLVDSYLHTQTQAELFKLLARGGVIGGTSAGCSIQASYLVRGARAGNKIMMAPGYEEGFGFLRNVALDQHLLTRHRENDLPAVLQKHPELLGIGLDENTAIVVHGDEFEVLGQSKIAIYDPTQWRGTNGESHYFLQAGDRFNLAARRKEISSGPLSQNSDQK
jgi:cyanophycinase